MDSGNAQSWSGMDTTADQDFGNLIDFNNFDDLDLPDFNNITYSHGGTQHGSMADALDQTLAPLPAHARILVYCFRGGKRSRLWADTLQTIGFRTERLEGGWKRYRRWVIASLESLPRGFDYRVLNGPTGCGKTRLLGALAAEG